ncbi:MAG: Txe/YoeB family addiction module toxin [Bacilli bacterium]|nr:Txe/YoeB family addiction module toxin [Bacilli bacterium]
MYRLIIHKSALRDFELIKRANLSEKVNKLLRSMSKDPFFNPPPYEKLVGDLKGYYSRRINIRHRLVYKVDESSKTIVVACMWGHYL